MHTNDSRTVPVLLVTPGDDVSTPHVRPAMARDVTSRGACIVSASDLREFPVYVLFDGLAPYVVEARVVGGVDGGPDGLQVEFTTMIPAAALGLHDIGRSPFVHRREPTRPDVRSTLTDPVHSA